MASLLEPSGKGIFIHQNAIAPGSKFTFSKNFEANMNMLDQSCMHALIIMTAIRKIKI